MKIFHHQRSSTYQPVSLTLTLALAINPFFQKHLPVKKIFHHQSSSTNQPFLALPDVTVVLPDEPVEEGSSLTVSCESESNPPASSFSWSLDGVVLDSDDSSSLTIPNVDWSFHTRRIECTATNAIGSGSTAASIAVLCKYTIFGAKFEY